MRIIPLSIYFPFRLAWRQLTHDKVKFLTAISGVVFACILVFMQLGFKDALFESATLLQRSMSGQVYIVNVQSEALWRLVPFPQQRLYRAMSIDGVKDVTELYSTQTPWKSLISGKQRSALILGINPLSDAYQINGLDNDDRHKLTETGAVLFDELSRPEFGPVKELLQKTNPLPVEISGQKMNVVGTFKMGMTFSADGNIIVNQTTYFKLFPNRTPSGVDIGIISLKDGVDPQIVQMKLREILPPDVKVMTKEEYIIDEKAYWQDVTPIGYIFNFGVIIGLFVGFVIVYQVLFNDITNHLHEYATLKAIGYDDSYFTRVVLSSAAILAAMGFIPGFIISASLYEIVEKGIFIAMNLPLNKVGFVFILINLMCFCSAFVAVRKLRSASPVDVFS